MSICLQGSVQYFGDGLFAAPDQEMALHVDDINQHKEQGGVASFMCNALHSGKQLGSSFLNRSWTSGLDRPDGKLRVSDGELFEVRCNQCLGRTRTQIGGSGGEYLL